MEFEPFEWEFINDENFHVDIAHYTYRAKVIGGWLVKNMDVCQHDDGSRTTSNSIVFIKDITHEWKLPQYR